MDISRPHSPVRSHLATTTSINWHALFSNKNNMTSRLLGGLDTFKNVHHNEAKAGLPHIFANTPITTPEESIFNLVKGQLSIVQTPAEQTNFRNLGELALIHALIDDLSDRLIHYRKIEDEHFKPGLYHAQICEGARPKTCKMKNRNTCSWKLVLIWPFSKTIPPPAAQEIPDLRVTNHHGNVYSLEEVLPELDAQDFKEHVQNREEWGEFMEEYLSKIYGADSAWRHEREMHFRQWKEEIEGENEENTHNEEIEFKQIKGFIPMDPILEEPEDVTSENETSDDNTSGDQMTSSDIPANYDQSFQETLDGNALIDDSSGTENIIYKADLATIRRMTETFDTPIQSVSHFATDSEEDNLEAMPQKETRRGKWTRGMSERFEDLLRRIGRKLKKEGKGKGKKREVQYTAK
ncbi:hypothetical protein NA56DRAFT_729962 [Hyaloscypha hepaticicola]|uniref:Uncharacterized protein n=1 Tax=Hyaloscypha hepaticicola TaxID=2082293 RepID=A0A2J6QK73_9HELO|nr:hypothetical protein NA56DRAFT_729962 [Hyaloscypha hepaticicola]